MFGWFKRKDPEETRASGSGFTAEIIGAREAYISGRRGLAELTATVQSCISLWEGGLILADVEGDSGLLDRMAMGMLARSVALRGDALFLIRDDRLVPVLDWDMSSRDGEPRAYRLTVPEIGGGRSQTALAAEVLHIRVGADPSAPWTGVSPLRRAQLTAGMLHSVETALSEAYENMPLGSQIVPFPESPDVDLGKIGREFKGSRGKLLLRESVNVVSAGGPAPQTDWKPQDVTPDLSRAMTRETLDASRGAICAAYGVLPALFAANAQGPLVREAQRHLAQWQLQPIAQLIAEEASEKLGAEVKIDTMRPLQAFDTGGRARAAVGIVQALAQAKEAGIDPDTAMKLVNWEG